MNRGGFEQGAGVLEFLALSPLLCFKRLVQYLHDSALFRQGWKLNGELKNVANVSTGIREPVQVALIRLTVSSDRNQYFRYVRHPG